MNDLVSKSIVEHVIDRDSTKDKPIKASFVEKRLPHEYAISGWFKFVTPPN